MLQRSKRILFHDDEKLKRINSDSLKLLQKYRVDMLLRDLSQRTIYSYENDIQQWLIYVYDNQFNQSVCELTDDDIEEFLYYCKMQGNNVARMRRRISSIAAFYKFLRKKKLINENPTETIDRPKHGMPVMVQTFLTKEQVDLLREKLVAYGDTQLRLYILFSLSTMCRVTAASSIRWEQVDFDNRIVHDVVEKEGKIVDLFFSEEVKDIMLLVKEEREYLGIDDFGWMFYTSRCTVDKHVSRSTLCDWCHTAGKLIGIDTLHPHDLRHTMATLLRRAGMPLEDIAALLNHESTDTTRKFYIKEDGTRISKLKDTYNI